MRIHHVGDFARRVLVMLGPALVTTEGYSAAEVGKTYERALDLSRRLDGRLAQKRHCVSALPNSERNSPRDQQTREALRYLGQDAKW